MDSMFFSKGGDCVYKSKREGYSLVELLIAMAITTIVLGGLITMIGFGTHNMRLAHALVALQNQAKDAMNHMSTYTMEASDIEWDDTKKILVVTKESVSQEKNEEGKYPDPVVERCYYWTGKNSDGVGGIYFAKGDKVQDPNDATKVKLEEKEQFLLADDIQGVDCKIRTDGSTGKKVLHIEMKFADEDAEFVAKKDVYMRNQKSIDVTHNPNEGGGSDV